jgi:predicted RND superfamily exporter protein
VIALIILLTGIAAYNAAELRIVIDPAAILPQSHPFVASKSILEGVFDEHYILAISITPNSGQIAAPFVLVKVQRITDALRGTPGVVKSTLLSVASENAKAISHVDGGFQVTPFRNVLDQPEKLLALLAENPLYQQTIVSGDDRTFMIIAEFKSDPKGYASILSRVEPLINQERDASVTIRVSGHVEFLGEIERYTARMFIFVPVAVLLIALVLFDAFRSIQGLLLPLVTAVIALIWVLGIMGASGLPLDVFNATTPILILAVAAGHSVQILKRYYEEYDRLRTAGTMTPTESNHAAVVASISKVGRFMISASLIAAAGFLSLTVFEIKTVKIFGIFTGLGILSALIIELTFMPALRSSLRPPPWPNSDKSESRIWNSVITRIARSAPTTRPFWVWSAVVLLAILGSLRVHSDSSNKAYMASWTQARQDDSFINSNFAGTEAFYMMIDTGKPDGIMQPQVLQGLQSIQRALSAVPGVGKTISIADYLTCMNQAMHGHAPQSSTLPGSADLAAQYLLLYSMSGDTTDLTSFVDFDDRRANLKVFVRRDDSNFILSLVAKAQSAAQQYLPPGVTVTFGGGVAEAAALHEVMIRDKLLSILQIVIVVFFASSLLFRSFVAGCLVLLPLLIAVLVNFGVLGWLGIPLNIPTSLISAMIVGIGADYAIYVLARFREEVIAGNSAALDSTLNGAGKACLYVAASVALGYGVLIFSFGFRVHQWLALLIACAMMVSVLASISLIPAIVIRFRPRFIFSPQIKSAELVRARTSQPGTILP